MKLRSGKILPSREYKLPEKLDNLLETRLQKFKTLFSDNPEHAKELLKIISKSKSIEIRFDIREKIEEVYDINDPEKINPLMGAAGDIAWLLVGSPQYHDIIEKRIKNFDLETPLLGDDDYAEDY